MASSRVYTEQILKDSKHHKDLLTKGYFIAKVLNDSELAEIQNGYEKFRAMISEDRLGYFSASLNVENKEAVMFSKNLIDKVFTTAFNRMFLEDSFSFTGGVYMMKKSGEDTYHPLHRDIPMIDERKTYGIYSWTPITKMDETTGRMFVVPGSNHSGTHQRSHLLDYAKIDDSSYKDSIEVVNVEMGETMFFDSRLLHGSLANTSCKTRAVVNFYVMPKMAQCVYFAQNPTRQDLVDVYEIDTDYFFEQEHHRPTAEGKHLRFLYSEPKLS